MNLRQYLLDTEKELIHNYLVMFNWNISEAARQLGMKRTTLQMRMKRFEIKLPPEKAKKITFSGHAP